MYVLGQGDVSFNSTLSICRGQMLVYRETEVVSKRPIIHRLGTNIKGQRGVRSKEGSKQSWRGRVPAPAGGGGDDGSEFCARTKHGFLPGYFLPSRLKTLSRESETGL